MGPWQGPHCAFQVTSTSVTVGLAAAAALAAVRGGGAARPWPFCWSSLRSWSSAFHSRISEGVWLQAAASRAELSVRQMDGRTCPRDYGTCAQTSNRLFVYLLGVTAAWPGATSPPPVSSRFRKGLPAISAM